MNAIPIARRKFRLLPGDCGFVLGSSTIHESSLQNAR
jgi:hypothetical protein